MAVLELKNDRPWPHIGRVDSQGEVGTGFIVKGKYALTASHLIGKEPTKVFFVHKDRRFEAEVIVRFNKDIALLRLLSDDLPLLAPLPLGLLTDLPVAYTTWGYRSGKENMALQGFGIVRARLEDGSLQLETQTQRPGMSGSPVAIGGRGGLRIVAIAVARYYPEDFQDDEPLAFAYALAPLPPEVLQYLGDLEELQVDRSLERVAEGLYELYREKTAAAQRMTRIRNAFSVIIFVVFVVAELNLVDSLIWLPIIALLAVSIMYFWLRSRELQNGAELANILSGLIRSADPDAPLQEGFRGLLEALK